MKSLKVPHNVVIVWTVMIVEMMQSFHWLVEISLFHAVIFYLTFMIYMAQHNMSFKKQTDKVKNNFNSA